MLMFNVRAFLLVNFVTAVIYDRKSSNVEVSPFSNGKDSVNLNFRLLKD